LAYEDFYPGPVETPDLNQSEHLQHRIVEKLARNLDTLIARFIWIHPIRQEHRRDVPGSVATKLDPVVARVIKCDVG
jgi:hypothetical protein